MRVAFGLKAHSGWATLVAVSQEFEIIDRRRIELADDRGSEWPGQPYHAAEGLPASQARSIVKSAINQARRLALSEMRAAVKCARDSRHDIAACAVLTPAPMPDWSTEEILAVHFRMHKAEGVLYPDALCRAAETCGLKVAAITEKSLRECAEQALASR